MGHREVPWAKLRAMMLFLYPGLPFPPLGPKLIGTPALPPREPQASNLRPLWPLNQVLCFKQCPLP